MNLALAVFLSVSLLSFETNQDKANSFFTLFFLVLTVIFPLACYILLKLYQNELENKRVKERYETLYEQIQTKKEGNGLFLIIFFLLRRLVLAGSIIFLPDNIVIQLLVQTLLSLYYLRFLVFHKPYSSTLTNALEILNEVTIITSFYQCYLFTAFVNEQNLRYQIGWIFIAIIIVNFVTNLAAIVIVSLKILFQVSKQFISSCLAKRRLKQTIVPIKEETQQSQRENTNTNLFGPLVTKEGATTFMNLFSNQNSNLEKLAEQRQKYPERRVKLEENRNDIQVTDFEDQVEQIIFRKAVQPRRKLSQ